MPEPFFQDDKLTALQAKESAQWIAFGPTVFQAARVLRNSGILQVIEDSRRNGIGLDAIAQKVNLPVYGVRVLLEAGLSIGLVTVKEDLYRITKTGYFILHDPLTRVNMDFEHDICYKAMFTLDKSIETGTPVGLKEFGEWKTVYEGLAQLPKHAQESWFNFDHFFSDDVFRVILPLVYRDGVKKLLDIGGNTGKWAIASTRYQPDITVTIVDLPGQLEMARGHIEAMGLSERVSFLPANILEESFAVPAGFDAIWLSQCLDCFAEAEIISILKRCHKALNNEGFLFILEPFWDRQRFEIAAFCLHQTSLYFTTVANGNSQMYSAEVFLRCIRAAGFEILEETNQIGLSQTLLKCRRSTTTI
ncbi:MAG: methyltransferase domain-containing protein [Chitinophagaceae bacterium]|nr:methyltransferase domain-containing protein [Chitinophagaceae bacterium]